MREARVYVRCVAWAACCLISIAVICGGLRTDSAAGISSSSTSIAADRIATVVDLDTRSRNSAMGPNAPVYNLTDIGLGGGLMPRGS